jgi:hypothetical protein
MMDGQNTSPEERIIRELFLTKQGGLAPGSRSRDYGRVFETLLIREAQILARLHSDTGLKFARGYVVDDYGGSEDGPISKNQVQNVTPEGPRFDIVCYTGRVAWTSYDGLPMAVVPKSYAHGVIEAKRTLSPGYFPRDSSRAMNEQFIDQQAHLDELALKIPFVVVGAHYRGSPSENRRAAMADYVALLGDLSHAGSAVQMAQSNELKKVIKVFETGKVPRTDVERAQQERVSNLQDIAGRLNEDTEEGS